jgi:hypothetical protein
MELINEQWIYDDDHLAELEAERDKLRARVVELEQLLRRVAECLGDCPICGAEWDSHGRGCEADCALRKGLEKWMRP